MYAPEKKTIKSPKMMGGVAEESKQYEYKYSLMKYKISFCTDEVSWLLVVGGCGEELLVTALKREFR
jgi:hypothetical protein